MICADGSSRDRVLPRALGYMGADIIFSPTAWAVAGDHDNVRAPYGSTWTDAYCPVAKEFSLTIAGVSCVGPVVGGLWKGYDCIGHSLVVGPDGLPLAQGRFGADAEELIHVDVRTVPRPARGGGWWAHWSA